jgi:GT2 family glycosyltransferase
VSVSVSVVTYRSADHIEACLEGVRAQGACVGEVLLADNGSADGTVDRVRARHPEVRMVEMGRNAGFAAAHNCNFSRARGGFVLSLNPDVELRPGYVAILRDRLLRDAALGAATGRLLTPGADPRIDSAGAGYDRARTRFVDRGRGAAPEDFAREEDVFAACAAATLYRRAALDAVSAPGESPFAERLFMYYEDVDLAWRLRRAGWRVRYCPDAEAVHGRGGSGADDAFVEYHLVRNRPWVSLRNASGRELLRELPGLALLEGTKLVQSARRPHLRAALLDQLRGIGASLAERRRRRQRQRARRAADPDGGRPHRAGV